jgi:hypothetical protein
LARSYTERGIQILGGIAETGDNDAARIAAIKLLLDRGYGAVKQTLEHVGDETRPLRVNLVYRPREKK